MNELTDFIKTLNVLYVEDDTAAREISTKILKRFFNSVESCENGLDGYLAFQKRNHSNENFDLIISDINMPKMDGVDMLERIREHDKEIPVIFITARNESNILLKAIELQVINYIIKPLDINKVSETIHKSCEKIFLQNMFLKKQRELEIYLNTIEQIAFITKINLDKNITYINDIFCENLGYLKEEILGNKLHIFKDDSVNILFYEQLEETISSGKIWEGIIKAKDKRNELVYLKSAVTPIFDYSNKNIIEYISISYLVTEEENNKKEFHKKILQNITAIKKDSYNITLEKEKKDEEIFLLKKYQNELENQIIVLNNNKINLLSQLEAYEKSTLNQSSGRISLLKKKNDEAELLRKAVNSFKQEKVHFLEKVDDLNNTIQHHENLIEIYKANETKLVKKIKNLEELINDLENSRLPKEEKKGFFK